MFGRRLTEAIEEWIYFYSMTFDLQFDPQKIFSNIVLPKSRRGFDQIMLVPQGLTSGEVFDASTDHFAISSIYEDLNSQVVNNDRDTITSYALRLRDCQEPVRQNEMMLVKDLKDNDQIDCMTLLERLLYGLKFFIDTGAHLDEKLATFCVGSSDSQEQVPFVSTKNNGQVTIDRASLSSVDPTVLARQVIT
jgi:hypothetical protein